MTARRNRLLLALSAMLAGCAQDGAGPDALLVPSFAAGRVGRPSVLVNATSDDNGTAKTIQEGIDMVSAGGKVLVVPGTYNEAIVIDKGLTLEGIGGESGPVVIAPPGSPTSVIELATTEPVMIRGITVHVPGANGIRGFGPVNLTVEGSAVIAVNPQLGVSNLIFVANDAGGGSRARMVVRHSFVDGTVTNRAPPYPQSFALRPQGDVDAVFEGNILRRTGGACIFVVTRADLGGELNAEILNNDLDECHPLGRVSAILVGPVAGNLPSPTRPLTATGVVNIIGNTIRNSAEACVTTTAIAYEVYTGRIERNRIVNVVQECAAPTGRNLQGGIWVGRLQPFFPAVTPTVRFNDIVGNAHAGLRIASNQTVVIDASCNYWGSADGPSGAGLSGTGDALVVEGSATPPAVTPFATAPIAATEATSCS